jgi:hypothetical protein
MELKGLTGRKPPEPSDSHADIDEWFGRLMPHLQPIVRELDELIRAQIPGLQYAVKWRKAFYAVPGLGWIIELAAYDISVNVVFLGGVDFDPAPPLGVIDRTRYVKITSLDETKQPQLQNWIEQSARTSGWR